MSKPLNIIQKKSDIMNAISLHFSDQMCRLHKQYKGNIPQSEEAKVFNKLDVIERFLAIQGIDVQALRDINML